VYLSKAEQRTLALGLNAAGKEARPKLEKLVKTGEVT
jgi:hypothetical protein